MSRGLGDVYKRQPAGDVAADQPAGEARPVVGGGTRHPVPQQATGAVAPLARFGHEARQRGSLDRALDPSDRDGVVQPLQIGWSGVPDSDRGRRLLPLVQLDEEGLEVVDGRARAERADDVNGDAPLVLDIEDGEPGETSLETRFERWIVWSQNERDEVRRHHDGCVVPVLLALAGQQERLAIATSDLNGRNLSQPEDLCTVAGQVRRSAGGQHSHPLIVLKAFSSIKGDWGRAQIEYSTPVSYTHLTLPTNREV